MKSDDSTCTLQGIDIETYLLGRLLSGGLNGVNLSNTIINEGDIERIATNAINIVRRIIKKK